MHLWLAVCVIQLQSNIYLYTFEKVTEDNENIKSAFLLHPISNEINI